MKDIKKLMITLVALLALTTQAWAQTETLLTTITATAKEQASYSTANVATVSFSYTSGGSSAYLANWGWWGYGWSATVTAAEGYTITKCIFYDDANRTATDSEAPFVVETTEEDKTPRINGTPIDGGNMQSKGIKKIEVYGYVTPAASTGPKVAWDKDKKTGQFTMPGGNVELEPEYYPQAVLATGGAPTAIDNVPATTDGAIVKAGTVANITGTTTAQGTVMYYVSQTALDDAALLALAADAWTADVPTAESFTAAGTAHVYYYVRGNDSDTDEENFSDGDILSANKLTVTIAAAPTYAVTFADDTAEPDKWTASPNANVTKGQPVTVTYTGTKKVLGVKAEKKAAAVSLIVNPVVGQIIGSDGKNYDADATLPTGVTAVAKIFYVGSDNGEDAPYNHGLALALSDVSGNQTWSSQTSSTCLTTQYSSDSDAKADMAGLANTDALVGHDSHTHNAASAARNYNSGTHPTGTSAWFLPSAGQWDKMATAAGGYGTLKTNAGLQSGYYWSSSERNAKFAWYFYSVDGDWSQVGKGNGYRVRACLAF